jgi:hypothetical protein
MNASNSPEIMDVVSEPNGREGPHDLVPTAGRLSPEARRAVIELLRQGVVFADTRRLVFDAIRTHRAVIADHLADMQLRVLIDEPEGLALLLSARPNGIDEEDDETASLISRRTLTVYDTLLLIILRKHFLDRETAGDMRIRIDVAQIEALMTPFLPLSGSTRSDRKKLNGAIEGMKKRKILNAVRGEGERIEISPVIRYVVNVEYLEHLLGEYRRLADAAPSSPRYGTVKYVCATCRFSIGARSMGCTRHRSIPTAR